MIAALGLVRRRPAHPSLWRARVCRYFWCVGAAMFVVVFTANTQAAEAPSPVDLGLLLSPEADYSKVCRLPGADIPTRDWTKWQGEPVDEDPARLLEIAESYAGGSAEVRRNKVVARRLLEYLVKSDAKVVPDAQRALALLLIDPEAGRVDAARAVSLLSAAVRSGVVGALVSLGEIYEQGKLVPSETVTAAKYYQQAAAAGDADGALSLVRMYREGLLEPPTTQVIDQLTMISFSMLFSELGAGDCSAVRKIAELYGTEGSPLYDTSKAVRWYEAAVKMRDVDAAMSLANAYRFGLGVEFDNGRALELLNMAASEGSARAMRTIGEIHLYGEGVVADHAVALYWLEQAARSNDVNALALIAQVNHGDFGGLPNPTNYVEALERLAKLPNRRPKVLVELARALLQEVSPVSDGARAKNLLEEAASLGETDAFIDLALMSIKQGNIIEQPIEESAPETTAALQAPASQAPATPIATTYIIKAGDSLSRIGGQFDVSVDELMNVNGLRTTLIISGDTLKIPSILDEGGTAASEATITQTEPQSPAHAELEESESVLSFPRSTRPASGFVRARSYLRSAANAGNGEAMRVMSSLYECGIGLDPNADLALRWLERAAAADDVVSLKQLASDSGSASERIRLFKAAARRGDRESMIDLSIAYRIGEGTEQPNPQLSTYWRARALGPGSGRNAALVRLARDDYRLVANADDVRRVVNMLTEAAIDGEQRANVELAKMLLVGAEGLQADPARAIVLLVQAANAGSIEAAKSLAELPVDVLKASGRSAFEWLERAAGQGDVGATVELVGLATDGTVANNWLNRVQGQTICDADIMVRLAEVFAGRGAITPDQAKASFWLDRASKMLRRTPATNFRIALAYTNGVGGEPDEDMAARHLKEAADGGDPEALRYLGVQQVAGATSLEKWKSALGLFERASTTGDEKASIDLMEALYNRKEVPPEIMSAAVTLVENTAHRGSVRAMRELGLLFQSGTGVETNAPLGADWLKKAALGGDIIAMRELGRAHRSGFGVPLDPKESVRWMKAAAENGDQKAMHELASAYRIGFGVQANQEEASKWEAAATPTIN